MFYAISCSWHTYEYSPPHLGVLTTMEIVYKVCVCSKENLSYKQMTPFLPSAYLSYK